MFAPFPLRARSVPPRSPAAQLSWPVRPGWAARHMRLLLSRPRHPRDVHAVGAGAASVHVVGARRRSGACSLPIAPAREFPLCCGGGLSPGVLCRVHATGGEGCVRSGRHRPQKRARSAPSRRLPLTVEPSWASSRGAASSAPLSHAYSSASPCCVAAMAAAVSMVMAAAVVAAVAIRRRLDSRIRVRPSPPRPASPSNP